MARKYKWRGGKKMIDHEQIYHVYPLRDLEEHTFEMIFPAIGNPYCTCKCEATTQEETDRYIIVHNSFDGREGVEWANELLKPD